MISAIRFSAIAIAMSLGIASVAASAWFGVLFATGEERYVYAAIFGSLDALKLLLPALAAFKFAAGCRRQAFTLLVAYALLAGASLTAHVGLYAISKDHTIGGANEAQSKYANAVADKERLEAELAELGKPRPVASIVADISNSDRDPLFARTKACVDDTLPASRDFCSKRRRLIAEKTNAERVVQLRQEIEQASADVRSSKTAEVFHKADAQAEQLARMTGRTPDDVRLFMSIFIALLIELGSSIVLEIAASPMRSARREEGEKAEVVLDHTSDAEPVEPAAEVRPPCLNVAEGLEAVQLWVGDHLTRRKNASVPCVAARETYEASVRLAGSNPLSANAFGRAMSDLGYKRKKIGGRMHYVGAALRIEKPALKIVGERA